MQLASATIPELMEFSLRQAFEIVLARGSRVSAEKPHDIFPLLTVRPNIPEPVDNIGDIVGHLVRNRLGEIVIKIPGKNERIVANHSLSVSHPVHPGCPPVKIKQHRNLSKITFKQIRCLPDSGGGLLHDQALIQVTN